MGAAGMSVIWVNSGRFSAAPTLWTLAHTPTELLLLPDEEGTITATSGAVSQIRDFKNNGRLFNGAAGSRPTITPNALNGKASLTFNGSQWLTFAGLASVFNMLHTAAGAGATVVAVWRAGNIADPNVLYGLLGNTGVLSANHGLSVFYDDRSGSARNNAMGGSIVRGVNGHPAAQNISANNAHPVNAPTIITHTSDPGNAVPSKKSILRVNGVPFELNTFTNAPSTANATFPLQIGATGGNSFPLVGEIFMISILPPGTIQDTILRAEGYAAGPEAGWNLQSLLPTGHPYKFGAPTV
jgi:hypothetical protein